MDTNCSGSNHTTINLLRVEETLGENLLKKMSISIRFPLTFITHILLYITLTFSMWVQLLTFLLYFPYKEILLFLTYHKDETHVFQLILHAYQAQIIK